MDKYAVGTVEMLVTSCARAAKDFGWASPRESARLQSVLKGLANLRGVTKKKKLAMVADHVAAIMDLPKPPGIAFADWALNTAGNSRMVGVPARLGDHREWALPRWASERRADGLGCV